MEDSPGGAAAAAMDSHQSPRPSPSEEKELQLHGLQRQLLLILHAKCCSLQHHHRACHFPNCESMKNTLGHLNQCKLVGSSPKCSFENCYSSRLIISHWVQCGGRGTGGAGPSPPLPPSSSGDPCPICDVVKHQVNKPIASVATIRPYHHQNQPPEMNTAAKRVAGGPNGNDDHGSPPPPPQKRLRPLPPINQFNVLVWRAVLEWGKVNRTPALATSSSPSSASPSSSYTKISLPIQVFTHTSSAATKIGFVPDRIVMKLIPASILKKLGLMRDVRPLRIQFRGGLENGDVKELMDSLRLGQQVGYVHLEIGEGSFKHLILHYHPELREFLGYMPVNQKEFVEKLRAIVAQTQRQQQQQVGQQQQQQSTRNNGIQHANEGEGGHIEEGPAAAGDSDTPNEGGF